MPLKNLIQFFRPVISQKSIILAMAGREVRTRYAGSFLGLFWTFIQPAAMIVTLWAIFGLGFRVRPQNDVPFLVWLVAGLASWHFFSESINGAVGGIVSHTHLVKKYFFHVQILPVITLCSCLVTHVVFVMVLMVMILFQGMAVNLYFLQFIYYLICTIVLTLGLAWAVSALHVFIRDVGQIVRVAVQIGFWLTPIFWEAGMLPPNYQGFIKLNPMFYIVQGYRDSFIYAVPFWDHPYQTIYFWAFSLVCLGTGAVIFSRLKPQFADVL